MIPRDHSEAPFRSDWGLGAYISPFLAFLLGAILGQEDCLLYRLHTQPDQANLHRTLKKSNADSDIDDRFQRSTIRPMSSLLWQYYFADDVEKFQRALARATYNQTKGKGKSGHGALSTSPGTALSTSPTLTKSRKGHDDTHRNPSQQGLSRADGPIGLSRADVNWKDAHGVTLLHRIASSNALNASEFANALLQLPLIDLYIQDEESGWTALHRALYFGNIYIARALMDRDYQDALQYSSIGAAAGGLIKIKDREGYSPFDVYGASIAHRTISQPPSNLLGDGLDDEDGEMAQGVSGDANEDQESRKLTPRTQIDGDELFAFGSNKNFTLGFGDEDDRQYPERIQLNRPDHLVYRFHAEYRASERPRRRRSSDMAKSKPFGMFEMPAIVRYRPIIIQDVQLSKLHSAILTTDPEANLYMCGFGSGGRLGTGDETTRFGYVGVHGGALTGKRVIHIALGQNHTIAISNEGETFTWGSNAFGQLGYASNANSSGLKDEEPVQLLPRQVFGPLKHQTVVGAAASRIHSAVITASSLFTFGKNEGQMGLVDSDAVSQILIHLGLFLRAFSEFANLASGSRKAFLLTIDHVSPGSLSFVFLKLILISIVALLNITEYAAKGRCFAILIAHSICLHDRQSNDMSSARSRAMGFRKLRLYKGYIPR